MVRKWGCQSRVQSKKTLSGSKTKAINKSKVLVLLLLNADQVLLGCESVKMESY